MTTPPGSRFPLAQAAPALLLALAFGLGCTPAQPYQGAYRPAYPSRFGNIDTTSNADAYLRGAELGTRQALPNFQGTTESGGHWVSDNIGRGKIIKLEDGSLWEVASFDRFDAGLWMSLDDITVVRGNDPLYPALLVNTDSGETVNAKLIAR